MSKQAQIIHPHTFAECDQICPPELPKAKSLPRYLSGSYKHSFFILSTASLILHRNRMKTLP